MSPQVFYFKNKYFPYAKEGNLFDQNFSFSSEFGVAFTGDDAFFASSINRGGNIHFIKNSDLSISDIKDWVAKTFGDQNPIELRYMPGTFYKRIWRPLVCAGSFHNAISLEKVNQSFVSLKILLNKLEKLFETIEPVESNLLTYGHKIREVLLLACMEVESSWAAVLRENNYNNIDQLTTNDYVKLKEPMFLDAYYMELTSYPSFPIMNPFKDWDKSNPTKSLSWYDAYNKTKHNREDNLLYANLQNVITAVSAAVVMFYAQFGFKMGHYNNDYIGNLIRGFFKITTKELGKYEKEFYIPKISLNNNLPQPSWDWVALDYPF